MEKELKNLVDRKDIIDQTWKIEVDLYERGVKQEYNLKQINPRIFPYHEQCLLLMDMYASLDGPFEFKLDMDDDVFVEQQEINGKRFLTDTNGELAIVHEYLPCSSFSVMKTFLPLYRSSLPSDQVYTVRSFIHLQEWIDNLWLEKNAWIKECYEFPSYKEAQQHNKKKNNLRMKLDRPNIDFVPKGTKTKVLLKLLKHSMSELQRDHRLALAVMLSLIENKCFDGHDGVEAMRYFLLTVYSENIYHCNQRCHDQYFMNRNIDEDDDVSDLDSDCKRPDHYCKDYKKFIDAIKLTISNGIELMTEAHATLLVTFMQFLCGNCGWKEVEDMKELIGYDDDSNLENINNKPHTIINAVITGLGLKALEGRYRLKTLLRWKYSTSGCDDDPGLSKEIEAVTKSHQLSVDALVRIGKMQLLRFPADSLTEIFGGRLVRYLLLNSMDLVPHEKSFYAHIACPEDCNSSNLFIGHAFSENESVTNENRYADGLTNEFKAYKQRSIDIRKCFLDNCDIEKAVRDPIIQKIFLSGPSQELQNVVKGLFLSQLVDCEHAGCGYGDFLVWCRLPIHIHEPMLYEHIVNYPIYNDDDSDSDENDELKKKVKYYGEDGINLEGDYLKARYDFSLLLMKQEWAAPWRPENHCSFQLPFREAVWSLLLCAHRYHLGSDIPKTVCSFLARDWWPDDRVICWRYECEIDNIANLIFPNHEVRNAKPKIACDCKTAYACSKKHMNLIHREGHSRVCQHPPIRYFNHEDALFCQNILGEHINLDTTMKESFNKECTDEEDDDASCWESIGSDEVEDDSKTELIYQFFVKNAYKYKVEEQAFYEFYRGN